MDRRTEERFSLDKRIAVKTPNRDQTQEQTEKQIQKKTQEQTENIESADENAGVSDDTVNEPSVINSVFPCRYVY